MVQSLAKPSKTDFIDGEYIFVKRRGKYVHHNHTYNFHSETYIIRIRYVEGLLKHCIHPYRMYPS